MNHCSHGSIKTQNPLTLSRAIDGFVKFKTAEGLSKRTIDSYEVILNHWVEHVGDRTVSDVQPADLVEYMAWLRTDYIPQRWSGSKEPLSAKSIRNVWVAFKSFFGWLNSEFGVSNPAAAIRAPRVKIPPIEPLTREEVERLLRVCLVTSEAKTELRKKFSMRKPTANRDQSILLVLLDTGLRATELCSLIVNDLDLKTGKVTVRHGVGGGAKGGKGRTVYMGKVARKAVWRYLAGRDDGDEPGAPLFTNMDNRPFTKDSLRQLIHRMGVRAGVKNVHPHRFRHTFAITYLRSGGDLFTLQSLLGHNSLDMVRHYAKIAEIDVENAHRRASPADNWRL